jgi:SnoaL-like polyketide cyclase
LNARRASTARDLPYEDVRLLVRLPDAGALAWGTGGIIDVDVDQFARDHAFVWDVAAPKDLADRLQAPDVLDHDLQPRPGLDGVKQVMDRYQAVFPDLHPSHDDVLSSGDRIAVRWSATGTDRGRAT